MARWRMRRPRRRRLPRRRRWPRRYRRRPFRRRPRRRSYRPRRSRRNPVLRTNYGGTRFAEKLHAGVPMRKFVTLRYPINNIKSDGTVEWYSADYGQVFPNNSMRAYRGNSVNDPASNPFIIGRAGGRVFGIGQWANFYKASYVFASTMFLRITVLPMRVYSSTVHSSNAPDVDLFVMAKTATAPYPTDRVTSYMYPRKYVKWVHMGARGNRDVWTAVIKMRRTTKFMFKSQQEEVTPGTANNPFVQLAPAMDTRFYESITAGAQTIIDGAFTWYWLFNVWNRSPPQDTTANPDTVGGQVEWTAEGFVDYHTVLCNPVSLDLEDTDIDTAGETFANYDEPATDWIDEIVP